MKRSLLAGLVALALCGAFLIGAEKSPEETRRIADKDAAAGNFKDAYGMYEKLATDAADDPGQVSHDLTQGILCLQRLGRSDEIDDFREKTIAAHAKNWRLLQTAANSCLTGETYGFIVAGKFYRGNHRGQGRQVFTLERDRVRALQLMQQAVDVLDPKADKNELGEFYFNLSTILLDNRYGNGAWRLQYLTDLSKLPDYEDGYPYNTSNRGAPVNDDGTPVFHKLPKSFKDAATDGERWRWSLMQAAELSPELASRATYTFAEFLRGQFDVQTMAMWGYPIGRGGAVGAESEDDTRKDESGPYAVRTLGEDETIARLANSIKRFKLPFEFNFIRILQTLADTGKGPYAEQSLNLLGQVFEDRQQYDRAAEYWRKNIAQFGPGPNNWKQQRLDQIVGNWAQFDPLSTAPAGKEAVAWLLFRNGKHVSFEAFEVDVPKLLKDVKAYIGSKPGQLDWQGINIDNLGYRLVEQNQQQYVKGKAAEWQMDLTPREKHFDKRMKVIVPVKKAGAYLITAKMQDGNTTRVVLWSADTVLVKKALDKGSYYFVADAVTGQPISGAKLDYFGYQQRWEGDRKFTIDTKEFSKKTDADGQVNLTTDQQGNTFSWLITASSKDGRLAYWGFTNIWAGPYYDQQYNQQKVFLITDRPVYRPAQTAKFKFWIGEAKYDQEGRSPFANATFKVIIQNPKGEKVLEKPFTADAFGGFDGEFPLPKDATLGVYSCVVENMGGGSFRVEEYKKPEFEVTVDAPTEPVMLGDKITATLKAKYYFGAPVVQAKVKYKVMRTSHSADWYPAGRWDWFYQPGYWWFSPDYAWWPGWNQWGCRRPLPWWYGNRFDRPEIVAESEVPIGSDGTVKIEIDTALAKAVHGDTDHKYEITAEVTDQSRRTIVGTGTVLVARKPFKVYAWVDRGYYMAGDDITAHFQAQTLDSKPVKGKGALKLLKVTYKDRKPVETEVQNWALDTDDQGQSRVQLKAAQTGQYRLSYTVTDSKNHAIEGGYVFVVRGDGFDGKQFRFNDIELVTDKKEYQAGDTVRLMINADRADGTIVLFLRPTNGIYLPPKVIRMKGKSTVEEIGVVKKDMPNFFVEALTISDGRLHDEMREIVVPPESRVVNVQVLPSAERYKPGQKGTIKFRLTDSDGKPVEGSTVISIYDKSVEYISGGSNVPEIKSFFWKWRRSHYPNTETSLSRASGPVAKSGEVTMQYLGTFGGMVADNQLGEAAGDELSLADSERQSVFGVTAARGMNRAPSGMLLKGARSEAAASLYPGASDFRAPLAVMADGMQDAAKAKFDEADKSTGLGLQGNRGASQAMVEPTVRKNFADTALWVATLNTKSDGLGEVELTMPENLTTWKAKVWSIGAGTRVGEGSADVVTAKDLIVRLQAPRFFVQKDQVVISANVHNYLKTKKDVRVSIEVDGPQLAVIDAPGAEKRDLPLERLVSINPQGEKRLDWTVLVRQPGEVRVRVKALTDEESDAMEMTFPVFVHGMLKTESFSGAMRPADKGASLTFNVPSERLPEQSRIEVRYSPSVASAMVDALPYLVDYPYGCTEQTLNRFLPTVITQKVLIGMHLDLKDIEKKRTNLNAQEIGDDEKRAADWKRNNPPNPGVEMRNPVFDMDTVAAMSREGVTKLANMQLSDGGWGWFSGFGEQSWPHTTALVVHGLQIARENDVTLPAGILERGVDWLKAYQARQNLLIRNHAANVLPNKPHADDLDAFIFMVLTDAAVQNNEMNDMREFLYRDRNEIGVYSKAMFGLALHKLNDNEKLEMILKNISQYVVRDDENQTAYLKMPAGYAWWYWYGSDTEAMGYYLKLLSKTDPKGETAARLAKYLINNRKHASYWNSTRDTAICIEALADFLKASGEDKPDMTVAIAIDGKKMKEVKITADNFFSFDNKLVIAGAEVTAGDHKIEFSKAGSGPLYFNAYVTNFTLEDPIKKAGLEIRVDRKFYKLVAVDKRIKVEGSRGQALDQKVEKYERQPLSGLADLKSGDLVEVELEIDSKNDYEYILFEDMKASGFEPVEIRSGYNGNDMGAYMELHDERVCFFARALARGKHSVSWRLRAEIPGKFSALPTRASAMYAPELKANSDEMKLAIHD